MALLDEFDPDLFLKTYGSDPKEPEEDEDDPLVKAFEPELFLSRYSQEPLPQPEADIGKTRYTTELPQLNEARELDALEKVLAGYSDRVSWMGDLGKQESSAIRATIGDAKYDDDLSFMQRLWSGSGSSQTSQDVESLLRQSKAVTQDGPIADSPVFQTLNRYKELKSKLTPEQISDARAVDWRKNDKSYAELSNGSIQFRPEAFRNQESYQSAVNQAKEDGVVDDKEASAMLSKWTEIEAATDQALLQKARGTDSFMDFQSKSENAGLTEEAAFQKYKQSQTFLDKLASTGGAATKGFTDSFVLPAAGAVIPLINRIGEATDNETVKQVGEEFTKWAVDYMSKPSFSDDVRGGFGTGVDTAANTVGQAVGQVVQVLATRGRKGGGAGAVMLTGGLQTGMEAYSGVYQNAIANGKTHEQANEEASRAFAANVPAGFLEAVPIDRVLSSIPRGLVGKTIKAIGSGLSEVATENVQTYANNLVNQAVSSTYMEQQGMGLEENAGMFAGMTAVDVITGGIRGRISRGAFQQTMPQSSTALSPEERTAQRKLIGYLATDLEQSVREYRNIYGDKISAENIRKAFARAPGMDNPNVSEPAVLAFEKILRAETKSKAAEAISKAADKAASTGSPKTAEVLRTKSEQTTTAANDALAADILDDLEGDEAGDTETGSQGDRVATGVTSQEQPADKPADEPAPAPPSEPTNRENQQSSEIVGSTQTQPAPADNVSVSETPAEPAPAAQPAPAPTPANTPPEGREGIDWMVNAETKEYIRWDQAADNGEGDWVGTGTFQNQQPQQQQAAPAPVAESATPPAETPATPAAQPPVEQPTSAVTTPSEQAAPAPNVPVQENAAVQETQTPEPAQRTFRPITITAGGREFGYEYMDLVEDEDTGDYQPATLSFDATAENTEKLKAVLKARGQTNVRATPLKNGELRISWGSGDDSRRITFQPAVKTADQRPVFTSRGASVEELNKILQPSSAAQPEPAPEPVSTQQPTTPEGGDTTNEEEMQRRTETLNTAPPPQPPIPGAEGQGDGTTPPPAETPAPAPVEQGVRAAGAKGVISKKRLPIREEETGRDEEGRPITKVVPAFVNDPNTLAESLHQNGGAERIYIPDEVIDNEEINEEDIGFAFEKGTGRAYVTWARHSRYPDSPIMENGRTEGNETLEQLYQADPTRQANSEAQTQGEGVGLAELEPNFEKQLDAAELSDLEKNDPEAVARELAKIDSMAARLAEETVVTNDGSVATVGAALADLIGQAAKNKYLGRLRGIVSGDFADASGAVRDVKARALRALKSRGGENVGVSLDQKIGDGKDTVGDVTGASQALQDEEQSQQAVEQETEPAAASSEAATEPRAVDEAMQYATDMAVMELSDKDRKIWLEYKTRMTSKREGGRGQYITKDQKRVADQVAAKARENLVEMLAQEKDGNPEDASGLRPATLTEQEQAKADAIKALEESALERKVRKNTERMLDLAKVAPGEKATVRTVLEALSKDKTESSLVRFFANWLLKSGHNFSEVKVLLIANRDKRTNWAGLYKAGGRASSGTIKINTAADHRGSIGQTFLHEALHHIVLYKLRPSYKRNAVEKAAYRDLMKVLTYARRQVIVPEQGETLGQVARREFGGDDTFYGLTNIDELFTETLTNGDFFKWMNGQQAIPGLQTKGFFQNLWQQVRSLFQNLFSGVNVRPNSLLGQALDNIMALGQDAQVNAKITEYNRTATERSRRRQADSVRAPSTEAARFNELTADLQGRELTQADLDTWKQANPEKYAELEKMREEALKRAGYTIGPVFHGSASEDNFSVFRDVNERSFTFDESLKFFTDNQDIADFAYDGTFGHTKKVYLKISNPANLKKPSELIRSDKIWFPATERNIAAAKQMLARTDIGNFPFALKEVFTSLALGNETGIPYETPTTGKIPTIPESERQLFEKFGFTVENKQTEGLADTFDGAVVPPSAKLPSDPIDRIEVVGGNRDAERFGTTYAVRDSSQIKSAEPLNLENGRLVTPDQWGRAENPDIRYSAPASRAQRNRMIKDARGSGWKASSKWDKFVDAIGLGQGLMDARVANRLDQKKSEIRQAHWLISETAKELNRVVSKLKPDPQVLAAAIGNTENTLTDAQYDQWKKLSRKVNQETDPVKRQAAMVTADNYRLTQIKANNAQKKSEINAALNQLPSEVRTVVKAMRGHLDKLSGALRTEAGLSSNLQATIDANMEVYLNRSYEIFDNPDWAEFLKTDKSPESVRIITEAKNLFRSQLIAEEARRIRRNARMNNQPVPSRKDALAAARSTSGQPEFENQVEVMLNTYLRRGEDETARVSLLSGGKLPGSPNTSILKIRGQIPKQIRELWGEYTDPGVNYAKTYIKMASFLAEQSFQKDFYEMGMNGPVPFLWKEGVSPGQQPPNWVEIKMGRDSNSYDNVMSGVYGPEIVVEAFRSLNETFNQGPVNEWMASLTGMAMAMKTVYNPPQTYVRNFLGNGLIMLSQGYPFVDIDKLGFLQRLRTAGATTGKEMFGLKPGDNIAGIKLSGRSPEVTDYVGKLIRLGVMGDNVKANVIRDLTEVVFDRDPKGAFLNVLTKPFKKAQSANQRLLGAYSAGDDFWKIVAFESERSIFKQAYPQATDEALDKMAADRVRDVIPTYSKIPPAIDRLVKKQPYLAPYISWTSEIIRTTVNTYRHAWNDWNVGMETGNKPLTISALRRAGSAFSAHVLLTSLAGVIKNLLGMGEEDEDMLRRFLPDWQKNALLSVSEIKDGVVSFWDWSYLNPFDVLQEPFIAMSNEAKQGGDWKDIVAVGVEKAMDPWTGEQLFFGALMDVARGYTKEGIPLYNDADSTWNNTRVAAKRLLDPLTPGAFSLATRFYKGLQGEVSRSGKAYDWRDELKGAVLGQRPGKVDLLQVFQDRKVGVFKRMMESASDLATKEYRTKGTADLTKIRENYVQSNNARKEAFEKLRQDMDAMERFVPRNKLVLAMKAAGVTDDDINQIEDGKYVRRFPGNAALDNAISRPNYPARIKALIEARDSYPEVQDLTAGP